MNTDQYDGLNGVSKKLLHLGEKSEAAQGQVQDKVGEMEQNTSSAGDKKTLQL